MKLHASIINESGKKVSKGGNERLDIEISARNNVLARVQVVDTGRTKPLIRLVEFKK